MADTILMIHGMWQGGWCWRNYIQYFEARGYRCISPTLRHHDTGPGSSLHPLLGTTSLLDYVDDLEKEVKVLDTIPIVMGHSMGGLLAQMLATRIQTKALVLLAPACPYGIMALTPSVMMAFGSAIATWGFWKKPHRQTFSEAAYTVLNMMPVHQQRELHKRFVHESGRAAVEIGFWLLDPRKTSKVDSSKISCPVLTVVGSEDRITPPFTVRKIAAKYGATHKELSNHAHWLVGEQGWEKIADDITLWLGRIEQKGQ